MQVLPVLHSGCGMRRDLDVKRIARVVHETAVLEKPEYDGQTRQCNMKSHRT